MTGFCLTPICQIGDRRTMKRLLLSLALIAFSAVFASGQTLADAAREQQAKKKAPQTSHVYTNESMEFHAAPPDATPAKKSDDKADAGSKDDKDAKGVKGDAPGADTTDPADQKKAADAIKDKYTKQQAEVVQLQRELDVLVRENRLRAATFYADAGARLRDEAKYAADD